MAHWKQETSKERPAFALAHRNTRIEAEQRGARTFSRWSVAAAAAAAVGAGELREQRLVAFLFGEQALWCRPLVALL